VRPTSAAESDLATFVARAAGKPFTPIAVPPTDGVRRSATPQTVSARLRRGGAAITRICLPPTPVMASCSRALHLSTETSTLETIFPIIAAAVSQD
jgi:hypothetical protein